jgi:23S rRNA pseudouridine1911/1915/1917 synthase
VGRPFTARPGRLDAVVAAESGVPRAEVQRAIAAGRVLVDGRPRPKSFRLNGGETIAADLGDAHGTLAPEPGPLAVRFEDADLMVVSKPAGMVTHPTASRRTGTLVNRLLAMGVPLSTLGGEDRAGIVHRLDVGTSGLMIVAKDDRTHALLVEMFRAHDVERRYLALVRGSLEHDDFLIDAPLERRGARITARATTGRQAETMVEVLDRSEDATLVEARPRTGRTHQIRVHFAAIGHPILGDRTYGGAGDLATRLGLTRQFLHSAWIGFDHPITGERIEVDDPLPDDLTEALRRAAARPR